MSDSTQERSDWTSKDLEYWNFKMLSFWVFQQFMIKFEIILVKSGLHEVRWTQDARPEVVSHQNDYSLHIFSLLTVYNHWGMNWKKIQTNFIFQRLLWVQANSFMYYEAEIEFNSNLTWYYWEFAWSQLNIKRKLILCKVNIDIHEL